MIQHTIPGLLFGGDYSPEQWDDATVEHDIELLAAAHVNVVVLSVFTWAMLEPAEGEYHFEWLDKTLKKLYAHHIYACLATPTCAQPAWLSKKYPDVLPVDIAGRKRTHGMRVFFCVNSPTYRKRAAALATVMASRYHDFPGLVAWHVANEYGTYCYCDNCQRAFRIWLKEKYHDIETLNQSWGTTFWGRQVSTFDEIMVPSELNDDYRFNPSIQLDYRRFITDATKACFDNEANILRQFSPDKPVYTNISGHIENLNQFEMAKSMSFIGWDNYPTPREDISMVAMKHDLMRGLKHGQPYLVAEQSPNQQNWQPYNKLKRPGEIREIAYQGLAHGAEGSLFFQMKQSIYGQEKFHGAVIGHGDSADTRVYRDVQALGDEFKRLGSRLLNMRTDSRVAFYFDWDSWWDSEAASGPNQDLDYLNEVHQYYQYFYKHNIAVDFIEKGMDLSQYQLIMLPVLYVLDQDEATRISNFVKAGGTIITTYRSGVVDQHDHCAYGVAPGPLQEVLGIEVEETDALFPDEHNLVVTNDGEYSCDFVCDLIRLKGAVAIAHYKNDFYAGQSAISRHQFGLGDAYYIGTRIDSKLFAELLDPICESLTFTAPIKVPLGVELAVRRTDSDEYWFVINHNPQAVEITLPDERLDLLSNRKFVGNITLPQREVLILTGI